MAHRVFKPEPDRDLYLVWTTVADGPVFAGKRKRVARWLMDDFPARGDREHQVERILSTVDQRGSSDLRRRVTIWEDEGGGMIYAHPDGSGLAWLPFANLLAFTEEFRKAQRRAIRDGWSFHPSASLLEVLED